MLAPDTGGKLLFDNSGTKHMYMTYAVLVVMQVTRQLRMDGWPALSIHGDKSQQERDWVLSEFKQNKSPIMLATDVAARGLGMPELADPTCSIVPLHNAPCAFPLVALNAACLQKQSRFQACSLLHVAKDRFLFVHAHFLSALVTSFV